MHPESYEAAKKVLEKLGYTPEDITGGKLSGISKQIKNYKKLAEELGVGEPTLRDIVKRMNGHEIRVMKCRNRYSAQMYLI